MQCLKRNSDICDAAVLGADEKYLCGNERHKMSCLWIVSLSVTCLWYYFDKIENIF